MYMYKQEIIYKNSVKFSIFPIYATFRLSAEKYYTRLSILNQNDLEFVSTRRIREKLCKSLILSGKIFTTLDTGRQNFTPHPIYFPILFNLYHRDLGEQCFFFSNDIAIFFEETRKNNNYETTASDFINFPFPLT